MVPDFDGGRGVIGTERGPRVPTLFIVAVGFLAGVWLQQSIENSVGLLVAPALTAGIGLATWHLWSPSRGRRAMVVRIAVVATASMVIGAGRAQVRLSQLPIDVLQATTATVDRPLIDVEGEVVQAVSRHRRTSLWDAGVDGMTGVFLLRVHRVGERKASGDVLVVVQDGSGDGPGLGAMVRVRGWYRGVGPPRNPGAYDVRRRFRDAGRCGTVVTESFALVASSGVESMSLGSRLRRLRSLVREPARRMFEPHLQEDAASSECRALLAALLLGRVDESIRDVRTSVRTLGLAHLLAISGLHLGVVIGSAGVVLRVVSGSVRRWHGIALCVLMLVYVSVLDVRAPVFRAAVMAGAMMLGVVCDRRFHPIGLLSLAAIVIVWCRPSQLWDLGYQLSFMVVGGLVVSYSEVRTRWFGMARRDGASLRVMFLERVRSALVTACVAWFASAPLVASQFGMVSWLGVPLTLLASPLIVVLVLGGLVRLVAGAGIPAVGDWCDSAVLFPLARVFLDGVAAADSWGFAAIVFRSSPGAAWCCCSMLCVVAWMLPARTHRRWRRLRTSGLAAVALVLVCWAALLQLRAGDGAGAGVVCRIDMLDVADGSCVLVRSGRTTMLVDGGSLSLHDAGDRVLVPALSALGVVELDVVVITHANTDHFNGLSAVLKRFHVGSVRVTPQCLASDHRALHALLADVTRRGIPIVPTEFGDAFDVGSLGVSCLHPAAEDEFDDANDASMVLQLELIDGRRVLLTGDLESEGLRRMRDRCDGLGHRFAVLELPHHGARDAAVMDWVARCDVEVVLQSTGRRRYAGDAWGDILADVERCVTARDGACAVLLEENGGVRIERMIHALSSDGE